MEGTGDSLKLPEHRIAELESALVAACDVANWLTGATDLTEVPAWPEMRAKLYKAMEALPFQIVDPETDAVVGYLGYEGTRVLLELARPRS